jgi:hypothetical protein
MSAENIPWKTRDTDLVPADVYLLEYDKRGTLTSPRSMAALVEAAEAATDVVLFAHGWNNEFASATARFDRFFRRLDRVLRSQGRPAGRPFRPVYVGVVWPSTALVMPWERGPDIAGGAGADDVDDDLAALEDDLTAEQVAELRQILGATTPGPDDLRRAAAILATLPAGTLDDEPGDEPGEDPVARPAPLDADELIALWVDARDQLAPAPTKAGGIIDDDAAVTRPDVAGFNPLGLLREGIRLATVRQMKDRAGKVGAAGVARAVRQLVATPARVHLVGHSYGCRVALSAVAAGGAPSRDVDSVLLLQPALNALAFAKDVDGRPGGYRRALDRVRLPIVTTRSKHDMPLTKVFHLGLRRRSDLGEAEIAGGPSKFAALGGVGPRDLAAGELVSITMPGVGGPYPLEGAHRVVGVDGTAYIPSHGDVESDQTAWALLSQIREP